MSPVEVRPLTALYPFPEPGELMRRVPGHAVVKAFWAESRSDSLAPPDRERRMRDSQIL